MTSIELNGNVLKQEGILLKYTNVMRGFQPRYFVANSTNGRLDYYMSEDQKCQKPRCSIFLNGAVISPSDEDSVTFMVYSSENEMFKLKAQDAKERQHWVNILRLISQSFSDKQDNFLQYNKNLNTLDQSRPNDTDDSVRASPKLSSFDTQKNISEWLSEIYKYQNMIENSIKELPVKNDNVSQLDKNVLILKSISKSCTQAMTDCCEMIDPKSTRIKQHYSAKHSQQNFKKLHHSRPTTATDESDSNPEANRNELLSSCEDGRLRKPLVIDHNTEITDAEDDENRQNDDDDVFEENKSDLLYVLSNLKLGMDLTKVSLPMFLLGQKSLLETYADCFSHVDSLLKITDQNTPEDRIMTVLEWYLTSFQQIKKIANKKPFNSIRGETFNCSWKSLNGNFITYESEQISHHPPISAFFIQCKNKGIKLNGYIAPKSKFLGMSIGVTLTGKLNLKLDEFNEEYSITLPNCYIRSIVTNPWIELGDTASINCSKTDLTASIIFHVKPFYGGICNQIRAEIKNLNEELVSRVTGTWDSLIEFQMQHKENKNVNLSSVVRHKKRVRPLDKQNDNESRRVWKNVTNALAHKQIDAAIAFKDIIDKRQRNDEKYRSEHKIDYKPKLFVSINNSDEWYSNNWL